MRNFILVLFLVSWSNSSAWAQFKDEISETGHLDRIVHRNEKFAYFLSNSQWRTRRIFVCWEPSINDHEDEKKWVQEAISKSWEQYSKLEFSGWGVCSNQNRGIRIAIEDIGPHVKALGSFLDGMRDGMVLNFSFKQWSSTCRENENMRRDCIRSIAVHEFGHAIGFAHEQNRLDRESSCFERPQGSNGDALLTPYDARSVMNYCNPRYNNNGELSDLDIVAVRQLYGAK
ncbi:M57 family metalloprotease [Variovorax sp. J22R133]|uniref:M57 family metalloprotease n=1 Tax=Variovorax brevis TaxID=3053503 RepID=UPI002578F255|nr:M57 family metalloprotease [Variovorax sp. J22R133]MDM0116715.1 M57 family metalloprotease [Variovorax sp. J22R133]